MGHRFHNLAESVRQFQVPYPRVYPPSKPSIIKWKNLEMRSVLNKYSQYSKNEKEMFQTHCKLHKVACQ